MWRIYTNVMGILPQNYLWTSLAPFMEVASYSLSVLTYCHFFSFVLCPTWLTHLELPTCESPHLLQYPWNRVCLLLRMLFLITSSCHRDYVE